MSTTLAIRFLLGRYHATPWDRAVNEGEPEWPPSPWRILRALVATWHARWPELPEATLTALLDTLADPPCYRTPATGNGHTRHYLPDLQHRKGEPGNTDLTLDPFLTVSAHDELLVRWHTDLGDDQRQLLAKLAELLPYLGRSESACDARLCDSEPAVDETWWRPEPDGEAPRRARLLAVSRPVSLAVLETTTEATRKSRRTIPPGTRWVTYTAAAAGADADAAAQPGPPRPVTAMRFAVTGNVPMPMTRGVLLADEAHRVAGRLLQNAKIPPGRRAQILGTNRASSDHAHAHWLPLPPEGGEDRGKVRHLGIWVPQGLAADEVAALLSPPQMSGKRADGYEVQGFPDVKLLFQAAGQVGQVLPELCGPARRWRSLTPYLPVRHQKRQSLKDYLAADLAAELQYRNQPGPLTANAADPGPRITDRWALRYRRYRMNENMSRSRAGLRIWLEFTEPVEGPLLLGQLSHFGYGIFEPHND